MMRMTGMFAAVKMPLLAEVLLLEKWSHASSVSESLAGQAQLMRPSQKNSFRMQY